MERKIVVCVGTDEGAGVRVRLSLLIVEGDSVLSRQYHSVAIGPGDDVAEIRARVEAHLAQPDGGVPGAPWPAIPDEEWAKVTGTVAVFHPPHVVERHRERVAASGVASVQRSR